MHIVYTCEPVQPLSAIAGMHRDHLARRQRIEAAAVGRKAVEATKVNIDDAQVEILEKQWADRQKVQWFSIVAEVGPPRIEDVIRAVCKYFSITKIDLISARRTRHITTPRQIGYYLSKTLTKSSLPEIGRRFGNRDHTSAHHGVHKIERLILSDWTIAYDVAHVEAML